MPPFITYIVTCVQLVLAFGNLIVMVYALTKFLNKPNITQNERLEQHERRFEQIERKFENIEQRLDNGNSHFSVLDEDSRVTKMSLLAIEDCLLTMVQDQRTKDELLKKRSELYNYLTEK